MPSKIKPIPLEITKPKPVWINGRYITAVSVPSLRWSVSRPGKGRQRKYSILPNPYPPDDILGLLKLAANNASIAAAAYFLIKAWLDARASRRIKIKKGDVEIELQGGISRRTLERAFSSFRRLAKASDEDEIKIIENGKVVTKANKADYVVKDADVQASREIGNARAAKKLDKRKNSKK